MEKESEEEERQRNLIVIIESGWQWQQQINHAPQQHGRIHAAFLLLLLLLLCVQSQRHAAITRAYLLAARSSHMDEQLVETVAGKCAVVSEAQYAQAQAQGATDEQLANIYWCRYAYDPDTKALPRRCCCVPHFI